MGLLRNRWMAEKLARYYEIRARLKEIGASVVVRPISLEEWKELRLLQEEKNRVVCGLWDIPA